MKHVLIILIVALILKDISHLNDPYVMRGIAQAICLVFGVVWVSSNINSKIIKYYWPVFSYFFILLISMLFAKSIFYVSFQVISLLGVVLFSIAYFENAKCTSNGHDAFINVSIYMYLVACVLSVLIIPLLPSYAFDLLYGGELRFRGLFSKSSMVAAAGGILFGLSLYGYKNNKKKYIKYSAIFFGLLCVLLTQSRTFWISLFVASALTTYFYYPRFKKYALISIIFGAIVGVGIMSTGVSYDAKVTEEVLRVDSVSNLSGRLGLWQEAIENLNGRQLYIGYGFTAGAEGLGFVEGLDSRQTGKTTLHNGYIQSLMDSGLLGAFFYILIIFLSLKNMMLKDKARLYPYMFFVLIYLSVSNLGEATIYTASVYHSIVFWFVAVFALGLRDTRAEKYSDSDNILNGVPNNIEYKKFQSVRLR